MQYPMNTMGEQVRAAAAEAHVVANGSDKPTRTLWGDAFKLSLIHISEPTRPY